jgi:amino acid transporter
MTGVAVSTSYQGSNRPDSGTVGQQDPATPVTPSSATTPTRRRKDVVAQEKDQYGGIKWGSAFFGWLTAIGVAVILIALVAAAGAAVGVGSNVNVGQATHSATTAKTVGLVGAIALLVIVFIAYYCGGYVAGRMARFNGIKQGLAVWLWALLIAIVVAVIGAIAGAKYNVLATLNSFPRIPVNEGTVSTGGVIALLAVAIASLIGALLGGLAGMHFHRQVDKAGLGE